MIAKSYQIIFQNEPNVFDSYTDMDKLEMHQDFNPAIKIAGIEEDKKQQETSALDSPTPSPVKESGNDESRNHADRSDLGLAMFDEEDLVAEKVQKPKPQGDLENMFCTLLHVCE